MHAVYLKSFRILLVLVLAAVTYLAVTPIVIPGLDDVWDKLKHASAFYALALLIDYSSPRTGFNARKIALLLGYGVAIEVVQYFLPYRDSSLLDLVADASGTAAYALSAPLLACLPILRWRAHLRGV